MTVAVPLLSHPPSERLIGGAFTVDMLISAEGEMDCVTTLFWPANL